MDTGIPYPFLLLSLSISNGDQPLRIIHDNLKENNELLVQNLHSSGLIRRHQFTSPGVVIQLA